MTLEIRAKITLAVEQFKANAGVVSGIWRGLTVDAQKHAQAVDKFTNKNLSNRINAANAGHTHDMSKLSEFERAAVKSQKRMANEAMHAEINGASARMAEEQRYNKWLFDNRNSMRNADVQKAFASARQAANARLVAEQNAAEKASAYRNKMLQQEARQASRQAGFNNFKGRVSDYIGPATLRTALDAKQYEKDYRRLVIQSNEFDDSLNRTRYALYDIGTKLIAFGSGIGKAFTDAIQQSANFESAFTRVERTTGATGAQLDLLRQSLLDLSTVMPVTYEQITAVATLGAQMGIASDSITQFTKTVTEFSAITGIAVEDVAQTFGRLGQLLDVPASKFQNLASSVTYVGVNAVATDQEILTMSESISAAAHQAGFAADQVIGLSGALASLKVRPEEARGVIVRLFRAIDMSVSEGGKRLNDFASVMRMTSTDAEKLWKSDPSKFFSSFLQGAKNAGDLNGTITALGITNSRELNVIQRLAANTDLLSSTLADAHKQYILGTYASEAYAKVQDDLNTKMTLFQNVMQQVQASFGDQFLAPLKTFFDVLIAGGKWIASFPGPLKVMIGLFAALAAGTLLFKGTMLVATGGLLAMRLAMEKFEISSVNSMASFSTFKAVLDTTGFSTKKAAAATEASTSSFMANAKVAKVAALATEGYAAATRGLGLAMEFMQRAMPVIGGLLLVGTAIASIVELAGNASKKTSELGKSMIEAGGGADELLKAVAADTQVFKETGNYIGKMRVQFDQTTVAQEKLNVKMLAAGELGYNTAEGLKSASVGHGVLTNATEIAKNANDKYNETLATTNDLLKQQEFALGANTAAFMANALAKYQDAGGNEQNFFTQFTASKAIKREAEAFGFNISDLIAAGLKKKGGATDYVAAISSKINILNNALDSALNNDANANLESVIKVYQKELGLTDAQIKSLTASAKANGGQLRQLPQFYYDAAKANDALRISSEQAEAARGAQIDTLVKGGMKEEAAADIVDGVTEQLKQYLQTATALPAANEANVASFQTFADGLKSTGNDMSQFTENGRTNMANFRSFMTSSLEAASAAGTGMAGGIERIASGLLVLQSQGKSTGEEFKVMQEYLNTAVSAKGFNTLAIAVQKAGSIQNLSGLISGLIKSNSLTGDELDQAKALQAALQGTGYATLFLSGYIAKATSNTQKAAKEMRSLGDYASDVMNLMKNSIDFKFSKSNGIIALKNATADINKNIQDAKNNLLDLQSTIDEKALQRSQLQTSLDIASQFGDTASIAAIRNEMSKLDAEILKAQTDLAYNNDLVSGSLDLNTQAGRDNVNAIQSLITANSEYINGLINSGASTKTVNKAIDESKTAFEQQLAAMGIAKDDISKYSKAFDGFAKIVKKTPKNVTIKANLDPATRALTEFIAKANASKATITMDIVPPTKEQKKAALEAELTRLKAAKKQNGGPVIGFPNLPQSNRDRQYATQIKSLQDLISSGAYADGGLISGFGGSRQDNIMIGASRGEFMMNAAAVGRYGIGFMNALNQQRVVTGSAAVAASGMGSSGSSTVYLSNRDRELLQAIADRPVTLRTSNRVIAQSANDGNKELARRGSN